MIVTIVNIYFCELNKALIWLKRTCNRQIWRCTILFF